MTKELICRNYKKDKIPHRKNIKDWKVVDAFRIVAEAAGLKGWPSPRRPAAAAAVVSGSAESLVSGPGGLGMMAFVAPFRLPGDIVCCL